MRLRGLALGIAILATLGCGSGSSTGSGTSAHHTVTISVDPSEGGNGNHRADPEEELVAEEADAGPSAGRPVVEDEIVLAGPRFTPQPVIRTGAAGSAGPDARQGESFDPSCVGTFPGTPQHAIKLGGSIPLLRIVVNSPGNDLTLAVRTADGVWHCNDDSGDPGNGLNPTVELERPAPGEIEIWVGVFSTYYNGAQYRLGITEQPGYASEILQ
jgi:hypothetical protein